MEMSRTYIPWIGDCTQTLVFSSPSNFLITLVILNHSTFLTLYLWYALAQGIYGLFQPQKLSRWGFPRVEKVDITHSNGDGVGCPSTFSLINLYETLSSPWRERGAYFNMPSSSKSFAVGNSYACILLSEHCDTMLPRVPPKCPTGISRFTQGKIFFSLICKIVLYARR